MHFIYQIYSSRAYELIAIADGTKTVEGIREEKAESMRKSRVHNVADTKQPTDSIGKKIKQPNNLGGRPVVDQVVTNQRLVPPCNSHNPVNFFQFCLWEK